MKQYDMIIIGGGPAGMAAAIAAYDSGVTNLVVIDREDHLGGILNQCIHNGFGLHKLGRELTGPEYAYHYAKEIEKRNIPVLCRTTVTQLTPEKTVTITNQQGMTTLSAKAVVLAMGCRERSRGALNIGGSRPAGVYSAGTAQKLMNCMGYQVGTRVVILGSGDIGLIMARRLTLQGAKVEAVCEVLPYSGGLTRNLVQCLQDYDIPLYLSTTVTQIHGQNRVEGVTVSQVDEHRQPIAGRSRRIDCDTLLLSCGLIPENELSRNAGIAMHPVTGGPVVDENRQTSLPGVFACGNVLQVHDLVDYVSDEAEIAGRAAAAYIKQSAPVGGGIPVTPGQGVRYVLPQTITQTSQPVDLFFRVTKPVGRVRFSVLTEDRELMGITRQKAAPGEMEKITLSPQLLAQAEKGLTLRLEELA